MTQAHNRYWYFPYNPKGYDAIGALNEQGFIYWHQGHYKYSVGDILFLYASSPVQTVVCKAEVVETDVVYKRGMDNDAAYCLKPECESVDGSLCAKVIPLAFNLGQRPDYRDLCNIGITGFQGPCSLNLEQVKMIEQLFQLD